MTPSSEKSLRKIWLKVRGEYVKDHKIKALLLAELLENFQRLLYELSTKKSIKREHLTLYVETIQEGSSAIGMLPYSGFAYLDGSGPAYRIIEDQIIDYLSKINNEKELLEWLLTRHTEKEALSILKRLMKLWSDEEKEIEIGIGETPTQGKFSKFNPQKRRIVETAYETLMKKFSKEIAGAITRVSLDQHPPRFAVYTEDGRIVWGKFDPIKQPELKEKIKHNIERPVMVRGVLNEAKNEFELVENIKPLDEIPIEDLDGLPLKEPILLKVTFEIVPEPEGKKEIKVWCLENDELNIVGCGRTLNEALERAKEDLSLLIEEYLTTDDEQLHESALRVKRKLKELVEG